MVSDKNWLNVIATSKDLDNDSTVNVPSALEAIKQTIAEGLTIEAVERTLPTQYFAAYRYRKVSLIVCVVTLCLGGLLKWHDVRRDKTAKSR